VTLELFKIPEHVKARQANPNPMVRKGGILKGYKCGKCEHLLVTESPAGKRFFKCRHRGVTSGAATDHRKGWDACVLYSEEGELPFVTEVRRASASH
jgi:hypothetical protein